MFTFYFLPVCLLISTGSFFISGISMAFEEHAGRIPAAVDDFVFYLFNAKYFSFKDTGFGGAGGRLGGRINPNDGFVMQVYGEKPPYLIGSVKNIYTGETWEANDFRAVYAFDPIIFGADANEISNLTMQSILHSINDRELTYFFNNGVFYHIDTDADNITGIEVTRTGVVMHVREPSETHTLVYSESGDIIENMVELEPMEFEMPRRDELIITGSRMATLFWPGRARNVQVLGSLNREILMNPLGDLLVVPPLNRRDSYRTVFTRVNLNCQVIQDFLRSRNNTENLPIPPESFLLPESVPQRVYDLAIEITAPFDNNFDKIKALERYILRFSYTLSPPSVPLGRDFVDFFLFDQPQGYCSYYASALAVLARCIGLPSRYMEGFVVPPDASEDGAFYITNRQAHAWAEIYFDGFGWVPFEATPAYAGRFYGRTIDTFGGNFALDFWEDPYLEDYLWQFGLSDFEFRIPTWTPTRSPETVISEPMSTDQLIMYIAAVPVLFILLYFLLLGFGILRFKAVRAKIMNLPNNQQVHEYFKRIIRMAAFYRYPMKHGETPLIYAKRIRKRFAFQNERIFMSDLVHIYYKGIYGGSDIPESDVYTMKECFDELTEFIKKMRRGPISKFRCYVLGYR